MSVYLNYATNNGKYVIVPNAIGISTDEASSLLEKHFLRGIIQDSSFSTEFPLSTIIQQFPRPGTHVKEDRMIYLTINRNSTPTVPLPNVIDQSLINATVVLNSNELKLGRINYTPHEFNNLVLHTYFEGKLIEPGERLPKGTIIDLEVGSSEDTFDFDMENILGNQYPLVLSKIRNWRLNIGEINIPNDVDTIGVALFVYKQNPEIGIPVKIGTTVDIWIAPEDYIE